MQQDFALLRCLLSRITLAGLILLAALPAPIQADDGKPQTCPVCHNWPRKCQHVG
jgi:hypothetical protein